MTPDTERSSGLSTNVMNSVKYHDTKIMMSNKRTYKPADETEREFLGQNTVEAKGFHHFNKRESTWNDLNLMSPRLMKYSSHNVDPLKTFKKAIRNKYH